jgi:hypothetical protein
MSTAVVSRLPASDAPAGRRVGASGDGVLPAWPLGLLLWGYPVFWFLGLAPFALMGVGLIMIALLAVRRRTVVVPGVLPWFAFVAWVAVAALMLDSPMRLIGYGFRFANLVAVGVVLLYVVAARERLTTRRALAGLIALWLTVVAGGYLALIAPEVRLTTPVGMLLPGALTSNEYVHDLMFPVFAEVQEPWGAPEPFNRPAAPFPYANSWGAAMVLLTPIAVAMMAHTRSWRVKALILVGLAASAVPAVASSNRGMFLGLGLGIVYVAVRLAGRGRVGPFLAVVAGGGAVAAALVSAGLLDAIATRQEHSDTTSGRASLYSETFIRTMDSPFLGWGAPRPSLVHDISVGTQGHIWMLMFSYGFVGLGLFVWFLWGATVRTWPAPGTHRLWMHATLVAASVIIFYYGLDNMQMVVVAVVAGLLLRDRYRRADPADFVDETR